MQKRFSSLAICHSLSLCICICISASVSISFDPHLLDCPISQLSTQQFNIHTCVPVVQLMSGFGFGFGFATATANSTAVAALA